MSPAPAELLTILVLSAEAGDSENLLLEYIMEMGQPHGRHIHHSAYGPQARRSTKMRHLHSVRIEKFSRTDTPHLQIGVPQISLRTQNVRVILFLGCPHPNPLTPPALVRVVVRPDRKIPLFIFDLPPTRARKSVFLSILDQLVRVMKSINIRPKPQKQEDPKIGHYPSDAHGSQMAQRNVIPV